MAPNDHRLYAVVENSECPDCDVKLELVEVGGVMGWLLDQGYKLEEIVAQQAREGNATIIMWQDRGHSDRGSYHYQCPSCGRQFEAYNGYSNDWFLAETASDGVAVITEEE